MSDRRAEPRWADVRIPRAPLAVTAAAAVIVIVLLLATRRFEFFYDEWDWVLAAPRSLLDHFRPHNVHWATLPGLVYTVLLSVFGARHYLPFMVVLLLLHAAVALMLFRIVRRRAGDLPALLSALTLLVLSRGWENLIWAFQMSFAGSVLAGLLAMDLLDETGASRARVGLASAALTLGLACSGIGLVFLGAVAVDLAFDRRRRSYLVALAAPVLVYGGWFLAFARSSTPEVELSPAGLAAVSGFVATGLGAVAAGLLGLGHRVGAVALAAVAAAIAAGWTRASRPIDSRALGALAGLVGLFVLAGLARWRMGDAAAAASRYLYVAAAFLLLVLADAARELPWRGRWRLAPWLLVPVVAVHVGLLAIIVTSRSSQIQILAAHLQTAWLFRDVPGLDRRAIPSPTLAPQVTVGAYVDARARLGSTRPEISLTDLDRLPAAETAGVLGRILPLAVLAGPATDVDPGCVAVDPSAGALDLVAPGGSTVVVRAGSAGRLDVNLWLDGLPLVTPAAERPIAAPTSLTLRVPDAGPDVRWRLRIRPPPGSSVCGPRR